MTAWLLGLIVACGGPEGTDSAVGDSDSAGGDSDSVVGDSDSAVGDSDSVVGDSDSDTAASVDADGDGWAADEDCDDADPAVSPGAAEVCNAVDDDCDGRVDFDNDVPEDRPTIQNAIYEAVDGEVICVAAGTYTESLDFLGRSVRVVGWEGAERTVVDAAGDRVGVVVAWGEVAELEGVTITGATQSGVDVEGSTLRLTSVSVSGNTCDETYGCSGVGVRASDATLSFVDVVVRDNVGAPSYKGGTHGAGVAMNNSEASWTRVEVSGNTGDGGYEGWVEGVGVNVAGGHLAAENLIVAGNLDLSSGSTYSSGGGVTVSGTAWVELTHASIVGNVLEEGGEGGGLAISGNAVVVLSESVISHNVAGTMGSGVAVQADSATITFLWNDLYGNEGAAAIGGVDEPDPALGNYTSDPIYLDTSAASPADWDLHPGAGSPLIDAGDPAETDVDGTRADVGAFGGPEGSGW